MGSVKRNAKACRKGKGKISKEEKDRKRVRLYLSGGLYREPSG